MSALRRGASAGRLRAAVVVCLVSGMMLGTTARATEGEHELWLGVDASARPSLGASAQLRYAWTDFWAVGATVQHRQGWSAGASTAAFIDARLTLDALTWVPSVAVGLGAATDWRTIAPRLVAAGALAYRPARDWSVRLRVGVEVSPSDAAAQPFISLSYGWIGGVANGLDF